MLEMQVRVALGNTEETIKMDNPEKVVKGV
jgi:hypothetical protein